MAIDLFKAAKGNPFKLKQYVDHMRRCEQRYGITPKFYVMSRCYELDDDLLSKWGNQRDGNTLSRIYNRRNAVGVLDNKMKFNEVYRPFLGRRTWVNKDTSFEEFREFADGLEYVFFKPVLASHGTGAAKYRIEPDKLEELYKEFTSQPLAVVEEPIVQHPDLAEFYDGAVNSVRVIAVQKDDVVEPIISYVRFGVDGVVDNFTASGVACAVDVKTGIVITHGGDDKGSAFVEHPVSHKKFEGFQVPHWDLVLECVDAAMRQVDGINYAGWDVAIRENDVVLIEGNSGPGISTCQILVAYKKIGLRPLYEKYLSVGKYSNFEEKVQEVVSKAGCSGATARKRLKAAYEAGLDYDFVIAEEIYLLTVPQIGNYAKSDAMRGWVDKVVQANGCTIGKAYAGLRHARKAFGIPYADFCEAGLFGADDSKLEEFAESRSQ